MPGTPPGSAIPPPPDSAAKTSELLSNAEAWLESSAQLATTQPLPAPPLSSMVASVAALKREQVRRRSPTARVRKPARVKQDFIAANDGDLELKAGDRLILTKANPARHWWSGHIDGDTARSGSFPKENVELLQGEEEREQEEQEEAEEEQEQQQQQGGAVTPQTGPQVPLTLSLSPAPGPEPEPERYVAQPRSGSTSPGSRSPSRRALRGSGNLRSIPSGVTLSDIEMRASPPPPDLEPEPELTAPPTSVGGPSLVSPLRNLPLCQ